MSKALKWLSGWKDRGSTFWSNVRRAISRASWLIIAALLAEAIFIGGSAEETRAAAVASATFSFLVFAVLVLAQPFLHGSKINAQRLFADALTSSALMILSFSLIYRSSGINFPDDRTMTTALDALYFSAVTFSTLGFGDFTPKPSSQLWAGIHAILGNLHLGFIVGSVFAIIQSEKQSNDIDKGSDT